MADKDQVQGPKAGEQSQAKEPSFDEKFNKGWSEMELLTEQETAAKAPAKADTAADDKESGKSTSDKTPYKVLKVQGKEVPVYSEDELIELAQKGADYTKKTQALADDRRNAEQKIRDEEKRINDAAKELNSTLDELERLKARRPKSPELEDEDKDELQPEDEKVYKEFGIDPRYADPKEISIVKTISEQRKRLEEIERVTQQLQREKADAEIRAMIARERETYPYDDIIDDQGQNITEAQLAAIITAKREAAAKAKEESNPAKWLKEAVQEVHIAQKKTRESLEIREDMDPEEFARKFPGLAEKLRAKIQGTSMQKDIVPPSLPSTARPVTVPTTRGQERKAALPPGTKTMQNWLDEGFNDPDTIKALSGG